MKAVCLTRPNTLELIQKKKPELKNPKDLLLRMRAVGICGSDLHYFKEGGIGGQVIEAPWVIGHEGSAEVADAGVGVTRFKPGDPVVFDPNINCGICEQCQMGRPHTCLNGRFLGCPGQVEGCLAEYIVLPESCCAPVGPSLDLSAAVLAEPLSVAMHSIGFLKEAKNAEVGILGAGPIGLCTLLALETKSVMVRDKAALREKAAEEWGAKIDCEPGSLDAVFECCGDQEALDQAIDLLKPGGSLIITGIPPVAKVRFDISQLRRKEITIHNVRRQNQRLDEAVLWVEENRFEIQRMVTHKYSMEQAQQAFEQTSQYQDGVLKAVIEIQEKR